MEALRPPARVTTLRMRVVPPDLRDPGEPSPGQLEQLLALLLARQQKLIDGYKALTDDFVVEVERLRRELDEERGGP